MCGSLRTVLRSTTEGSESTFREKKKSPRYVSVVVWAIGLNDEGDMNEIRSN